MTGVFRAEARTHFTEVQIKQKKEKRITIRLTPEQYDTIQAKAESAQMSVGTSPLSSPEAVRGNNPWRGGVCLPEAKDGPGGRTAVG